jgi:hypothetical protein
MERKGATTVRKWGTAGRRCAVILGVATLAGGLAGCGGTGIGPKPLEDSLSEVFTNLFILQQAEMGQPKPSGASLQTTTTCLNGTVSSPQNVASNSWVCNVSFDDASLSSVVTATYDVTVQTDGCYAASSDGPEQADTPTGDQILGDVARMMPVPGGRQVPNPLWLIDSCFDIT